MHSSIIRGLEDEFPLVNITGESGAGKSLSAQKLGRAFGLSNVNKIDSTDYVLMREMSATNSTPVIYDEYKPSEYSDAAMSKYHNRLKNVTTGASESRGNATGPEDVYTHSSPLIIIGESEIQGNAVRRRSIRTTFRKDVRDNPSMVESYNQLRELDLEQHARYAYATATDGDVLSDVEQAWLSCDESI
jgi:hypothetical protein